MMSNSAIGHSSTILLHSFFASEWHWVITPSPWKIGAYIDPENNNRLSAHLIHLPKIIANLFSVQELCILFACFCQKNMQLIVFFGVWSKKVLKTDNHEDETASHHCAKRSQARHTNKKLNNIMLTNSISTSSSLRKLIHAQN